MENSSPDNNIILNEAIQKEEERLKDVYNQVLSNENNKTPVEKFGDLPLERLSGFHLNGKMNGRSYDDIYRNEPTYVQWVLRDKKKISPKGNLELFRMYVTRRLNGN